MDDPPELQTNGHWRMAVWALRVGVGGLAVVAVGLIVLAAGDTPWVLALGVVTWLCSAAVTVTGVLRCHRELSEPRPGLWPMRFMLLRDILRAKPATKAS